MEKILPVPVRLVALALLGHSVLPGCQTPEPESGPIPAPILPDLPASRPGPSKPDFSRIQIGDRLQLFVMEDKSFNQELLVRERGDLILAPFGRIPVEGLTVEAAEKKIKSELERGQLRKATVILDRVGRGQLPQGPAPDPIRDNSRKIQVFMTGKVNRPGQHVITLPEGQPVGVYEAILIAGGIDRFGDEQKVHILRTDQSGVRRRVPVNIRQIRQGNQEDPPIGHGDIVVVPERVFGF